MGQVKEVPLHTISRRSDEQTLQIGDTVPIKDGVVGVVIAHYTPSGRPNEVHYIVELRSDKTDSAESGRVRT
jgi:hypothetical protein